MPYVFNPFTGTLDWTNTSGGGTFTQVLVDVGTTPTYGKEVRIYDALCAATSKIVATLAYDSTTTNNADEIEMSQVHACAGHADNGFFSVFIGAAQGPIRGYFKVNYTIA